MPGCVQTQLGNAFHNTWNENIWLLYLLIKSLFEPFLVFGIVSHLDNGNSAFIRITFARRQSNGQWHYSTNKHGGYLNCNSGRLQS